MLSRRRFLFAAPAIVVASSLMPIWAPKLAKNKTVAELMLAPAHPGTLLITKFSVNGGPATINVNGLGARGIIFPGGAPVYDGEKIAVQFDGQRFVALQIGNRRFAA